MVWTIITTISTVVIAFFAASNFILAYRIKKLSERQQDEFSDLLQALVVATLCTVEKTPPEPAVLSAKGWFNEHYKGETKIFAEDE